MGDLAFGNPFGMLTHGKSHFAVDLLREGMAFLGPFSPVPWLVRIGYTIPGVALSFKGILAWSSKQMQQRMKV